MVKKSTSLYLDIEAVEKLRQAGVTISEVVNAYLVELAKKEAFSDLAVVELELEKKKKQREIIEKEIEELERKKEELVNELRERQLREEISALWKELNAIIRENDFDVEASWEKAQPILKKLEEKGKGMTKDEFARHCEHLSFFL